MGTNSQALLIIRSTLYHFYILLRFSFHQMYYFNKQARNFRLYNNGRVRPTTHEYKDSMYKYSFAQPWSRLLSRLYS